LRRWVGEQDVESRMRIRIERMVFMGGRFEYRILINEIRSIHEHPK